MSYCRWSDGDVYAYEHCDRYFGDRYFAVHVAGRKKTTSGGFVPIGLKFDGEDFQENDLESLRDRLLMLRDAGYEVPQYAIDAVSDEIETEARQIGGLLK